MIFAKTIKFLLVAISSFLLTELVCAEMTTNQADGVLTITDIGLNPNGSFTVAINRNNFVVVKASNDDFTDTVKETFDASSIQRIRLFTGEGNDQVVFRTAIRVAGETIVQAYPDIDVQIQTGVGDDHVFVSGADVGNVLIQTGPDDDLVEISEDSIVNDLSILTSVGEDRVFVLGADAGDVSIKTGPDNDFVEISKDSVVNDLSILTSAGNDEVLFQEIDVFGRTNVFTGSGVDSLETYGSTYFGHALFDAGPSTDQISIGTPELGPLTNRENFFLGRSEIFGGTGFDIINVDNGDYALMRIDGGLGADCYVPYGTYKFDRSFRISDVDTCRPEFPFGSHHVYKTADGQELEMIMVKPDDWEPFDERPAILFIHGGAWQAGTPLQLLDHAKYFAKQGVVCVLVQYRLMDPADGIRDMPPVVCINDTKSAMRFLRSNAAMLGIDPNRIASSGASAGGHLAAFLGTIDGMDDPQDDLTVSARPDAMCLFCPVYNNGPGGFGYARMRRRYPEFSPAHNISSDDTPHIVMSGTADSIVPTTPVRRFRRSMLEAGVQSELRLYEGAPHSFFLKRFHDGYFYAQSLRAMHIFLQDLGWLDGPPVPADF